MKKIILIWDFDGAIGQINSSYPYNFNFENFETEINNVHYLLEILDKYQIKSCFAITGFSAEQGKYPYVFPELIKKIHEKGHEIASHSWRHEWTPIFKEKQISKSLKRSKEALGKVTGSNITGFVPPHNRPMTWIKRGAFSLGDRGLFPLFKMGDNNSLLKLLGENDYKWIRVSYKNIFNRIKKKNITGRVIISNGILVLENHYTGFDDEVINHILNTNHSSYTISAHPLMLSFHNKKESKEEFENFINILTKPENKIKFITPNELLK